MLLDNARVEALKKKRAEAAAKAAAATPPTSPVSSAAVAVAAVNIASPPNPPTPGPPSSFESLKSTPIKSEAPQVGSPATLKLSNPSTPTLPTSPTTQMNSTSISSSQTTSNEPKSESGIRDLLSQIRSDSTYFPLSSLKSPGPYPDGVHPSHRELYLNDDEFKATFSSTKEEFLAFPQWKQVSFSILSSFTIILFFIFKFPFFRCQRKSQLHSFKLF